MPAIPGKTLVHKLITQSKRVEANDRVFPSVGIIFCNAPTGDPAHYLSDQLFIDTMALGREDGADNNFAIPGHKVCVSGPAYPDISYNSEYLLRLVQDMKGPYSPLRGFSCG